MIASSPPSSIDRSERIAPGRSLPNARSQRSHVFCSPNPRNCPAISRGPTRCPANTSWSCAEGRDQLARLRPERLDERASTGDREVEPELLGAAHQPRLELLAGDVDLPDLAHRLHQLLEGGRHLAAIGDDAGQHERGVRVGRGEVAADLVEGLLPERLGVVDQQRPRLAEQRRRRQALELSALPLGGVDLRGLRVAEERERRLPQEVVVLSPEERHGRGSLRRHRSDSTVGVRPSKVTVIIPSRSVRHIRAPEAAIASMISASGCP